LNGTFGSGPRLLADAARDRNALRDVQASGGAEAPIPPRAAIPCPPSTAYFAANATRWRVFGDTMHFRAIATRCEKRDETLLKRIGAAGWRS